MTQQPQFNLPDVVQWNDGKLFLVDQTRLPQELVLEHQSNTEILFASIHALKVRGAPAIGIAGAFGAVVAAQALQGVPQGEFLTKLQQQADYLDSSRPTAVNLGWALRRMMAKAKSLAGSTNAHILQALEQEAIKIKDEDIASCRAIGEFGKGLVKEGMGVMTICNAGHLAVSRLGTALAPLYLAHMDGVKFTVYASETRPLLQGARLTSWELTRAGIKTKLMTDNMAGHLMKLGRAQLVITGADRIAANGDSANKIGTYALAVLAKHHGIPFYIAAPFSTIDMNTVHGDDIVIEQRASHEVTGFRGTPSAPEGMEVENPAFDVTPAELISGIITEKGILRAPFRESLKQASAR